MAAKPAFLVYEIDDLALTLDLCLFAKAKFKDLSLLSLLSLKSTQGSPCFLSLNQQKQAIDIILLRALIVVEIMNKYAKVKDRMNKYPKQRL